MGWVLSAYGLALCLLAPLRPMWLDELLQLSDTWGIRSPRR